MSKLWIAASLSAALALAGCGIAQDFKTRAEIDKAHGEMEKSLTAYKTCLAENTANPSACVAAKAAYEADLGAYNATNGIVISER